MVRKRASLSTYHADTPWAATLPTSVVNAMRKDFGVTVTAFISAAAYGPSNMYLEGVVFADKGGRFGDGNTIRTSLIMNSEAVEGFLVVQTLSSTYVVADWLGGSLSETLISNH